MVNGEPTETFDAKRGLRQGGPNFPLPLCYSNGVPKQALDFKYHPATLQKRFNIFSKASGLQANMGKSSIYFGGTIQDVINGILTQMGFSHGDLPFKYLDALCRSYVWFGTSVVTKKALVAWERVCSPKSVGGFNLINLQLWNKAVISKNCWDLEHKQVKLWIRWTHTFYIKGTPLNEVVVSQQVCWMVKKIIEARQVYEQFQTPSNSNRALTKQLYLHLLGPQQRVKFGQGLCSGYRSNNYTVPPGINTSMKLSDALMENLASSDI
ncbi:uncharacterized protein LOC132066336 [Lycium ferocissimum]|uniref:uncharacterized protein LOC132066336 n=1 Tax=Lycium ferocissimum TaxID=112874 RepID=UPI0028157303|nr:uncharacterized protein LOC132066336 [Lycium ferocissimum]